MKKGEWKNATIRDMTASPPDKMQRNADNFMTASLFRDKSQSICSTMTPTVTALNTLNYCRHRKKNIQLFICQVFMVPIYTSIVFLIVAWIKILRKKSRWYRLFAFILLTTYHCHQYKIRLSFAINVNKCKFPTNPYFYGGFKCKCHYHQIPCERILFAIVIAKISFLKVKWK